MDLREKLFAACRLQPLIAAHRGAACGNIPCNTLAAFDAAIASGADVIECDVIKSNADGSLFIFHRKMDAPHLGRIAGDIRDLPAEEIARIPYTNQDLTPTAHHLVPLETALRHLKGRAYINLDHAWYHFPETIKTVRHVGVEDQIILKSAPKPEYLKDVQDYAPDMLYLPIIKRPEEAEILSSFPKINFAGVEAVFADPESPFATKTYVEAMHAQGRVIWANAILYNYKVPLAAGHSDDVSVVGNPAAGWGWLRDMGYDIIQTDWPAQLKLFLQGRYPMQNSVRF